MKVIDVYNGPSGIQITTNEPAKVGSPRTLRIEPSDELWEYYQRVGHALRDACVEAPTAYLDRHWLSLVQGMRIGPNILQRQWSFESAYKAVTVDRQKRKEMWEKPLLELTNQEMEEVKLGVQKAIDKLWELSLPSTEDWASVLGTEVVTTPPKEEMDNLRSTLWRQTIEKMNDSSISFTPRPVGIIE